MKRKIVSVILTGVLALSTLSGCGANADNKASEPAAATAAAASTEEEELPDIEIKEETFVDSFEYDASSADSSAEGDDGDSELKPMDVSDCDTFTQIVNKLKPGQAYANDKISDTDVLFITSGTYDNDGVEAAIGAEIFYYSDDDPHPTSLGIVEAGGTAYPLAIKDGLLYVGQGHGLEKYAFKDGKLYVAEAVEVEYGDGGKESYSYSKDGEVVEKDNEAAEKKFSEFFEDLETASIVEFSKIVSEASGESSESGLPAYEYPGPELFYSVLYKYLTDNLSKDYESVEGNVGIPCPVIIAEDDSDKNDIKIWGIFGYYNYELKGETLEMVSGGKYPGCVHIKNNDNDYPVTKMEVVDDGEGYAESAKKIFGDHYADFEKADSDDEGFDATRAQIIANYVAANNLKITAFQDSGWDPVKLPKENIDSFYSQLD